jgi:hypothetical protein
MIFQNSTLYLIGFVLSIFLVANLLAKGLAVPSTLYQITPLYFTVGVLVIFKALLFCRSNPFFINNRLHKG